MEKAQVLELFELEFSDLILLSSINDTSPPSLSSCEEIERLQWITNKVMENLGPTGPGLIAIKSLPDVSNLRRSLLPFARKLALLNHEHRKRILKEHALGSDVPLKNLDRLVSSFAMQLKYENSGFDSTEGQETLSIDDMDERQDHLNAEFKNLGRAFKKLGFLMMKLGLCLARICDRVIGGRDLEDSLLESCSAKGRLIHYHSIVDNAIIREAAQRKKSVTGKSQTNGTTKSKQLECSDKAKMRRDDAKLCFHNQADMWQQWHYDYGIFTVLTSPMFMLSCDQECHSPNDHTYLQIFHPERDTILTVKATPESFIVQVGESADVLSKGKLRATLHCVSRPVELENLSREIFVVFLQPAWNKTFSLSGYPLEISTSGNQHAGFSADENHVANPESNELFRGIHSVVPPLSLRMRDGMTFAEFSRETTKQYYGGSGLQSKR